jgi:hypothetical protein
MKRNEVRRALHACLRAGDGEAVILPRALADEIGKLLPDVGLPMLRNGKSDKIRAAMGEGWMTCEAVTARVGFAAFHALKQMVARQFAEVRFVGSVREYRLTGKQPFDGERKPRIPAPEGYTAEEWAAFGPKQRNRIRTRLAAIEAGTYRPRPVAKAKPAKVEKLPRIPKPKPIKPEQVKVKPKRSLEQRIAIKVVSEQKGAPKVDLAVTPVLPDSEAWLLANRGKVDAHGRPLVEMLARGAISQAKPKLTDREKRLLKGSALDERRRA